MATLNLRQLRKKRAHRKKVEQQVPEVRAQRAARGYHEKNERGGAGDIDHNVSIDDAVKADISEPSSVNVVDDSITVDRLEPKPQGREDTDGDLTGSAGEPSATCPSDTDRFLTINRSESSISLVDGEISVTRLQSTPESLNGIDSGLTVTHIKSESDGSRKDAAFGSSTSNGSGRRGDAHALSVHTTAHEVERDYSVPGAWPSFADVSSVPKKGVYNAPPKPRFLRRWKNKIRNSIDPIFARGGVKLPDRLLKAERATYAKLKEEKAETKAAAAKKWRQLVKSGQIKTTIGWGGENQKRLCMQWNREAEEQEKRAKGVRIIAPTDPLLKPEVLARFTPLPQSTSPKARYQPRDVAIKRRSPLLWRSWKPPNDPYDRLSNLFEAKRNEARRRPRPRLPDVQLAPAAIEIGPQFPWHAIAPAHRIDGVPSTLTPSDAAQLVDDPMELDAASCAVDPMDLDAASSAGDPMELDAVSSAGDPMDGAVPTGGATGDTTTTPPAPGFSQLPPFSSIVGGRPVSGKRKRE